MAATIALHSPAFIITDVRNDVPGLVKGKQMSVAVQMFRFFFFFLVIRGRKIIICGSMVWASVVALPKG